MSEGNSTILILVILGVVLLVAIFVIPAFRVRRAVRRLIQLFREYSAIDAKHAKTPDELGIRQRSMMGRLTRGRDYRQDALNAMIQTGIVEVTEDGKLYLSEGKLEEINLRKGTSYYR